MNTYSFFRVADGFFINDVRTLAADQVAGNTPDGCNALVGAFDHLSQRVTLVTDDYGDQQPVVVDWQPDRPPDTDLQTWSWVGQRWIAAPTLLALQQQAAATIDSAAGVARLRYITEAPGQQGVYLRKAEQARAFSAAGFIGDVPPYIQAEADATGLTPQLAAERILAIADSWDNNLSPTIEQHRIGGKQAVEAAVDAAGVAAARVAAVTALRAV